jgi:4-amino-4-deoxy-L-arabinose transferase-like glycosyltransferase
MALLVAALGILERLTRYFSDRSLWMDEAKLAINICHLSARELTRPLMQEQGAPVGFLLAEKAMVTLFGTGELALRAVPVLAGVLSVVFFYLFAARVLRGLALLGAVCIFAFAEPLAYYASEVKQYSTDACCAALLLWLAGEATMTRPGRRWPLLALAACGAAAIWFSHPSVFVLAGAGAALLAQKQSRDRGRLVMLLSIGLLWLLSFGTHYWISIRALAANQYLLNYWRNAFAPMPPRSMRDLIWYATIGPLSFRDLFELRPAMFNVAITTDPQTSLRLIGRGLGVIGFLAAIAGIIALWRERQRRGPLFWLLIAPLAALVLAAMLQKYPIGGRLLQFAFPIMIVLLALGLEWLSRTRLGALGGLLWAVLALPLAGFGLYYTVFPPHEDEIRPVLQYVAAHLQAGDMIMPIESADAPVVYYVVFRRDGFPPADRIVHSEATILDPNVDEVAEYRRLSRSPTVWVVFAALWNRGFDVQHRRAITRFDAVAARTDEVHEPGAAAYRYDLAQPPVR